MARFKILNERPERLVLGKGGSNVAGTLIGLIIFGTVAGIGLLSILDEGGQLDPVMIVIFIVIGLVLLSTLANAISGTRVVLDGSQGVVTRTSTFALIPTQRQEMAFNLIRDVSVTRPGASAATRGLYELVPVWQVQLQAADGSTLVVNERGTKTEMNVLAQKVGTLLGRPVRTEAAPSNAAPAPATVYTPSAVMGSLYENLVAFAQSAVESPSQATPAPTISAFPASSPRLRQDDMERMPRERRQRRNAPPPPAPPPNTLATTIETINPDAPFLDVGLNLAELRTAAERDSALSIPPVGFSAPPVLTMPDMPALFSFSPALNMPSFPPLGGATMEPVESTTVPEIKEVEIQVSPSEPSPASSPERLPAANTLTSKGDSSAPFYAARQLLGAHKYREAETAYLRLLNTNPADAAVQNDLGVVYLEQNRLQDAERAFRRAIALDSYLGASRYNLGVALNRMGRRSEANEQFKTGGQNAVRNDEAYFQDALRGMLRAPLLSQTS